MRAIRHQGWQAEFGSKLMEPADAVRLVQPGDRVCVPNGVIAPALSDALWAEREAFGPIDLPRFAILSRRPPPPATDRSRACGPKRALGGSPGDVLLARAVRSRRRRDSMMQRQEPGGE